MLYDYSFFWAVRLSKFPLLTSAVVDHVYLDVLGLFFSSFFLSPKIRYNGPARACSCLPCLASDFLQGLVQRWHSPPKTGIMESSDSVLLCRSTAEHEVLHTRVHRQLHSHTRSLSSLRSKRFSVEPFCYAVFLEYLSLSINNSIKSFQGVS